MFGAKYEFEIMDTFHENDGKVVTVVNKIFIQYFKVMKGFESDEDQLDYLASLMSDEEDEVNINGTRTQHSTQRERQKCRTESKAFDNELDKVAKSRKRKLSGESSNKKRKEGVDDKTASLQGRLVANGDYLTMNMCIP